MNPAGWEKTPNALLAAVTSGRLSARALGVFLVLRQRQGLGLSLASDDVAAALVEGRDAVRTAYRELTAAGHLHVVTVAGGNRALVRVVRVYDEPVTAAAARAAVSAPRNPAVSVLSAPGNPAPENPAVKTYIPTTTDTPKPPPLTAGPSVPENPSVRHRTPPTCPTCQLLHYPSAACDGPPVLVSVPTSKPRRTYRGNRWSATAGRRKATG